MTALLLLLADPPNVDHPAAGPQETRNLAADPAHAATRAEMRPPLDDWSARDGEPEDVDRDAPMRAKRAYYERGLPADVSDEAYIDWWRTELTARS